MVDNTLKNKKKALMLPLLLSIGLLFFMYHRVFYKMALQWWNDPNYSHGFLIIPISAYLLWMKRDVLRRVELRPSLLGPVILVAAGCLYVLGQIAGELFTQRISLVVALIGLVFSFGGWPLWKQVWVPVCYLIFMVPLPYIVYDSLAFPMKLAATKISTGLLQLLGVSIFSEGNVIYLPNNTLEVADACSGIRSLLSVLSLSVIIALVTQQKLWKRIALIALSIPVVLFCNIMRIVITGILASKNPDLSKGFFHSFSGELIFILGVAIIFGIAEWLSEDEAAPAPVTKVMDTPSVELRGSAATIPWASFFVLAIFLLFSLFSSNVTATPLKKPLTQFPSKIDGFYRVSDDKLNENILSILGVDDYIMRTFKGPNGYPITLYIGYFEDQKEGAMIHSPKHCYPGSGWYPISSKVVEVLLPSTGQKVKINEYLLKKRGATKLVYYWYQSRGRVVANEYEDRAYMILDSILKRRSDGALVRVSGPANDLESARKIQLDFIKKLFYVLDDFLPS